MKNQSKTEFLIIGIICQLFGLFCFYTFWLMIFAVIFFIVGTLFILLSKKQWYSKILGMLPMFIAIGMMINALYFEKYIIPNNFKGSVYVLTDKKIGKAREYDFFTRVYRIPNSGVLFTKFNQKTGFNYRKFYQENKKGELTELGILDHRDYIEKRVYNPPKTEPLRDSLAVFTPEIEYDFYNKNYRMGFTVGKYNDIKNWGIISKDKIDSLRNVEKTHSEP